MLCYVMLCYVFRELQECKKGKGERRHGSLGYGVKVAGEICTDLERKKVMEKPCTDDNEHANPYIWNVKEG